MTGPNDRTMEKVRGLLAQAEHPNTSPEEAEAFTARAAALMAKYGIDRAMLAEAGEVVDEVGQLRVRVQAPYAQQKAMLVNEIATALRCQAVLTQDHDGTKVVVVVGFESDRERVEVLFTSLLLQAVRDLNRAVVARWDARSASGVAAFRRSWLAGFAVAVRERLDTAERRAEQEHTPAAGTSTALVLRDRSKEVNQAFKAAFPRTRSRGSRLSGGGYGQGQAAGRRADLGASRVGRGSSRALGK